jgi:hypothetical protein
MDAPKRIFTGGSEENKDWTWIWNPSLSSLPSVVLVLANQKKNFYRRQQRKQSF